MVTARAAPAPYLKANLLLLVIMCACAYASAREPGHGGHDQQVSNVFQLAVPTHLFDLILARPEATAITCSVLAYQELEGALAYGTQSGAYPLQTAVQFLTNGTPATWSLTNLQANTRYYYEFRSRAPGAASFTRSPEYSFRTARPTGGSFTFTMTADVHLDEHTTPEVYLQALANIRSDQPDFHIDLGNLFMTDKHATRDETARQYLAQRYYLGLIGSSAPLFLALGTHDGESARDDDGTENCLSAWSNRLRTRYFPDPVPDAFYTGNRDTLPFCGLRQNYYAWQWGDALFVVLDPFGYSTRAHGGHDGWEWSLGRTQYQWLAQTLAQSHASFKFVFIHNLLCGDQAARGGVEVAMRNEWGGKNTDGSDGFQTHRPGWDIPVHALLVRNHVAAVFKAHDNFYARQELDGIVYLMVPQPSFAGNDRIRDLETYGYKQGTFLGNSGHVRVTVSPEQTKIEYIRACPTSDETNPRWNGTVADRCAIRPGFHTVTDRRAM